MKPLHEINRGTKLDLTILGLVAGKEPLGEATFLRADGMWCNLETPEGKVFKLYSTLEIPEECIINTVCTFCLKEIDGVVYKTKDGNPCHSDCLGWTF